MNGTAGMDEFVLPSVVGKRIAASVTRLTLALLEHRHGDCVDPRPRIGAVIALAFAGRLPPGSIVAVAGRNRTTVKDIDTAY